MIELQSFISWLIDLYIWVLIAAVVLSWLISFNIVNHHNRFVAVVAQTLSRLTEPVLRPIKRVMPDLGGLDLSPLVAIIGLVFVQRVVLRWLARLFIDY